MNRVRDLDFRVISLYLLIGLLGITYARDLIFLNLKELNPISLYDLYPHLEGDFLFKALNILSFVPGYFSDVLKGTVLLLIVFFFLLKRYKNIVLCFIFSLNLLILHREVLTMEGNIWLTEVILFFSIFYFSGKWQKSWAIIGIKWSVLLIYFFSGLSKINSPYWFVGSGLSVVINNEVLVMDFFKSLVSENDWFLWLSNYLVIIAQVLYLPLFFTRFRLVSIYFMIILHSFIAIIFGYYFFSFSCIILNIFLLSFGSKSHQKD